MIHIIFGPSGSGKTCLCQQLKELSNSYDNVSLHAKNDNATKKGLRWRRDCSMLERRALCRVRR